MNRTLFLCGAAALLAATPARAALVVSTGSTAGVSCAAGVCTATAANAVLNAAALQTMLASGDVKVATGAATHDIKIEAPVTWASTSRLKLDARRSILVDRLVRATGTGAMTLVTNHGGNGGDLVFSGPGHVEFWDLTSNLVVNATSYTLIGDVASLASAATANPSGAYALANSYDALPDGVYALPPVQQVFAGKFEGLGNTISRLKIDINVQGVTINAGLFSRLDTGSLVRDLNLTHASVKLYIAGHGPDVSTAGVLVGSAYGEIAHVTAQGSVKTNIAYPIMTGGLVGRVVESLVRDSRADVTVDGFSRKHVSYSGGLVGWLEFGTVLRSAATGDVISGSNVQGGISGGLIGTAQGDVVSQSWATGAAAATGPHAAEAGGLIAQQSDGTVVDCYARGNALATLSSHANFAGGMMGDTSASVATSYSTGTAMASGGSFNFHGGFAGGNYGSATDVFWDVDTSGQSNPVADGSSAGITGLSDAALLAAIPSGFSLSIWAQSPAINGGYPYLIANQP